MQKMSNMKNSMNMLMNAIFDRGVSKSFDLFFDHHIITDKGWYISIFENALFVKFWATFLFAIFI